MKIIALGEILWDVFEHGEHLGGAPFNFAAHACRLGHAITFISAVGNDERGRRALDVARELGVSTQYIQTVPDAPTGVVPVTLDSAGVPQFVICRPAAYDFVSFSDECLREASIPQADWIYFGTLHQASANARQALARLRSLNPQARRFYDVNLRPGMYDDQLLTRLLGQASIVKLNEEEARTVGAMLGVPESASLEEFCRLGSEVYGWEGVCVTRGPGGCALLVDRRYTEAPGYPAIVKDTVGAGDAFAAAFLHGIGEHWPPEKIADFANRVGALVASRPGAIPDWTLEEARSLRA